MNQGRPSVAVVRGRALNPFELQSYTPLVGEFDLVAFGRRPPIYEVEAIGVPTRLLPERRSRRAGMVFRAPEDDSLRGLERKLRRYDLLHAADLHLGVSEQCARIARSTGAPLVLTCWENIAFRYDNNEQLRARRALVREATSLFLAVTQTTRCTLEAEGVDPAKIRVLPPGIDTSRFATGEVDLGLRASWGVPAGALCVVYVGRLIQEKGVVELALAVAALEQVDGRPVHLVLIGSGDQADRLRAVCTSNLGLRDRIHILPGTRYEGVAEAMRSADVVAVPSLPTPYWQEQFGMVLVEAMASGRAIVTTDSGSIPDVVADAAVRVPPYDVPALRSALCSLLADPAARADLGRRARRRAEDEFAVAKVAAALADSYRTLLR